MLKRRGAHARAALNAVPDVALGQVLNGLLSGLLNGLLNGARVLALAVPLCAAASAAKAAADDAALRALARQHNCLGCHHAERRVVGPAFRDVAKKYAASPGAVEHLAAKIVKGGGGVWGVLVMPAQAIPEADARALAQWVLRGAP